MSSGLPFPVINGPAWPGVNYFCTTRQGGLSQADWASFNLGFNTAEPDLITQANRQMLHDRLPAVPLWLDQVHGCVVVDADEMALSSAGHQRPKADAAVTATPGRVLAILTADCLPVVISDDKARVLGVAHAGWRGLAAGVLQETLTLMRRRAPEAGGWRAWIGPGISPAYFQVGADVYQAFTSTDAQAARYFLAQPAINGAAKWLADLPGLAARRLAQAGVNDVVLSGRCTYGEPDVFYSYRLNPRTGRMATVAWLGRAVS